MVGRGLLKGLSLTGMREDMIVEGRARSLEEACTIEVDVLKAELNGGKWWLIRRRVELWFQKVLRNNR